MAFWRATDVDLPQNSAIVTVNTGDDVGSITSGYIIQINAGQFLEVKTVNTGASPQTIELYQIYTGTAINGGTAIAAPTQGAIKEATEELRNLRTTYESLADSVSSTATANSVVKRNGSAQVLVADATANNHAVALGQVSALLESGLGQTSVNNLSNVDLDTVETTGFYDVNSNCTNKPDDSSGFYLQVVGANGSGSISQFAQKKTSGSPEFYFRTFNAGNTAGWTPLNPQQFGIGGQGVNFESDDANNGIDSGIYRATSSTANIPINGTSTVIVTRSYNVVTQLFSNGSNYYFRRSFDTGSSWDSWREIYHSGNSVNPLDYGIGIDSAITNSSLINNFNTNFISGIYRTTGSETGAPQTSGIASVINMDRTGVNGTNQIYVRGNHDDNSGQIYFRGGNGTVYSDWFEVYHSSNTNFNEFGGIAANDELAFGWALSSTILRFYIPINEFNSPSSINVVAGTFKVVNMGGTTIATGLSALSLTGQTTNRMLVVGVTVSGANQKEAYKLVSETSDFKFTYDM